MEYFDRIVTETVRSGIEPLRLTYVGIYDGHIGRAIAYRTDTEAFCASVGALDAGYAEKADRTETGVALTFRNIAHASREAEELLLAEKEFDWISVRAATSFLLSDDLYDALKTMLDKNEIVRPDKICLEFNKHIFTADRAGVRSGLNDLKTLGFRTLVGDFATDGFPITTLLDVPVEYVVLTPEVTALAVDRNKEDVLPSLVRFLRSMNVETIAAGVTDDAMVKELNKMECYGIMPSEDYRGYYALPLRKRHTYGYRDVLATSEEGL